MSAFERALQQHLVSYRTVGDLVVQGFLCLHTASVEQAADTAEAAAVDQHFRRQLKTFLFQSVSDTGKQTERCFAMRPRSSSTRYSRGSVSPWPRTIRDVLPVSWMTSCLHTMAKQQATRKGV